MADAGRGARPRPRAGQGGAALAAGSGGTLLSAAQRRSGRELGSVSAVADSKQTLLCTYLAAVLLLGLALRVTLAGESNWIGYRELTALDAADRVGHAGLVAWLRGRGGRSAADLA
ncbi:hypothetical protein ACH492_21635 [Streptomyces sp. NPDC019443]|uniref:hypothetical protein n=1 Tax=Streptomyces sp. NPDC019443 TaxID=3365061 RepID=UPI0037880806